ncbi:hypothetical protein F2Q68_00004546 [Brassica cretica]|uniref:Uncharacterized protein n=1 Tax=Brassica cretica TaxID=69181 RepID=A0A8S9JJL9_BRACR|nr:hypothetical protein F2Q68_00004546 [Brassica cretica]
MAVHEAGACELTCGTRGGLTKHEGRFCPTDGQTSEDQFRWEASQRGYRERERERERERKEVVDLRVWSILKTGQSVPLMIKWKCCPELVQFHGFRSVVFMKLETPAGNPKNCPEAREGSTRVEFSPDQYQGRFCPSGDQSSPVKSSRPLGFGQVFSDQPAAYRQRTLFSKDDRIAWCWMLGPPV